MLSGRRRNRKLGIERRGGEKEERERDRDIERGVGGLRDYSKEELITEMLFCCLFLV